MIMVAETGLIRHTFQNGQVTVTNLLLEKEEKPRVKKNFATGEGLEHLKKEEKPIEVFVPKAAPVVVQTKVPGITIVKAAKNSTPVTQQKTEVESDDARFLQQMALSKVEKTK